MINAGFLHSLFFNPIEGDVFLRNVCWLLTSYTALVSRMQNSSYAPLCEPQILSEVKNDIRNFSDILKPTFLINLYVSVNVITLH
jgi:hypothetical protein